MKKDMRSATNGLSGLDLFRKDTRSGACKGYFTMLFIVLLLAALMPGCGGSDSSGGGSSSTKMDSSVPAADAQNAALDTNISATFNNKIDASTISKTTFTVTQDPDIRIKGTVALAADGLTAVFIPESNLAASSKFFVLLTGVKDVDGNKLSDKFWTFDTGTTLSPTVNSVFPADFATGVATDVIISAVFSVSMDPLTIDDTTFTVTSEDNKSIKGAVALAADGVTATFTPSEPLAADTQFLARVTTGVKDLFGNAMKVDKAWVFQTGL